MNWRFGGSRSRCCATPIPVRLWISAPRRQRGSRRNLHQPACDLRGQRRTRVHRSAAGGRAEQRSVSRVECGPVAGIARQPDRVRGHRRRDAEARIPGASVFRVSAAAEQCVHARSRRGTGARNGWCCRIDQRELSTTCRLRHRRRSCFCPRPPGSSAMKRTSSHRAIGPSGHLKSKAFDLRSPDGPITRSPDPRVQP